jgi:dienelactone hydrolase
MPMPSLSDFSLATVPGLLRWYDQSPRRLAFRASTLAEALTWQAELRQTLTRLLGGFPAERCDLDPHLIETVEEDGFTRELVVFQSRPGEYVPCYVLIPRRAAPPYRPVIALHGHGPAGARHVVGLVASEPEAEHARRSNYDYARQLALRGFLVFAPTMRGFAERMEPPPLRDDSDEMWASSCEAASHNALLCGQTLVGLRVWDQMRLIDYIETRDEPRVPGLACVGLSGGGTATLYAAALEPRITCAVISCAFNPYRDSIMPLSHCACNYVPGIVQHAEIADIAGLIAPRPVLIEAGTQDQSFPVAGTRRAVEALRRIYERFDAGQALETDIFEGGHRWSGAKAYAWLDKALH